MTSYLFPDARFSLERLQAVSSAVGKDRLVVDVRCGDHRHNPEEKLNQPRPTVVGEEGTSGL